MKIGITYDLREDYLARGYTEVETAEFDRPDTIDAIDWTLRNLGYDTDRIGNLEDLLARLVAGDHWDMVFNIAEGLTGLGRESVIPALLEAYHIPYVFSDPLVLSVTLHKATAHRVLRDMGIPTPDFRIVERESDVRRVDLPFPLFAKPIAEGTGKGIDGTSRINTRTQLASVCSRLLRAFNQPVLVEIFLPGKELTVGILGSGEDARAVGVLEVVLKEGAEPEVYSLRNKERCEDLVEYRLANDVSAKRSEEIALAAWVGLGCRDGGRVDIRLDAGGIPRVMEINPLAGLHPEHSDLCILASQAGMSYGSLIEAIMQSAIKRHPQAVVPAFYPDLFRDSLPPFKDGAAGRILGGI